jgi:hypothetical protein
MFIVTLLLITLLVVWINFGRITSFIIGNVVNNYNSELNDIISNVFSELITDKSIQFESIKTVAGGGLQASFKVDNNVLSNVDIGNYQNKTNNEIISDLGITADNIPAEVKFLLTTTKQPLVLNFNDANGNPIINREISTREIQELLR